MSNENLSANLSTLRNAAQYDNSELGRAFKALDQAGVFASVDNGTTSAPAPAPAPAPKWAVVLDSNLSNGYRFRVENYGRTVGYVQTETTTGAYYAADDVADALTELVETKLG